MPVTAEKNLTSGNRIRFRWVSHVGATTATITTDYLTREPSPDDRKEASEMLRAICEQMGLEVVTLQ